jgi:ribose-phosphate pyrophosphokinase
VITDVIDTGGTLVRAAQALTDRGATQVIAAATHGVFSDDAVERLEQAGLAQLIITDPLPHPASIPSSRLVLLSSAPLPVRAISEVFLEGSVTSLSEGES